MANERRLKTVERQRQALELRKAGASYRAIAQKLGYKGPAGAYAAVQGAIKLVLSEPAKEVIALELDRLDALLLGLWPEASRGRWLAVDRVLAIMDRRAKYLGLDAPVKRDDRVTMDFATAARRIAEAEGLDPATFVIEAEAILRELEG